MKPTAVVVRLACLAGILVLTSCDDGDVKVPSPPATSLQDSEFSKSTLLPTIAGSWSGSYTRPGDNRDLTANVSQGGSQVTILTSLNGEGHLFTGYFKSDGGLYLVDASTDEIWTSIGPISENRFTIQDYLVTPENKLDPPVQVISFAR